MPAAAAAAPPNIVLVLADDLGIHDLSCYGRKDFATPNLDRLASQGARFTSAYCAQPICSPSRAALMTGKHPARLHLTNFLPGRADAHAQKLLQPVIEGQLPLEEVTLAEVLKRAGYATACIGKWHLGGPGFGPEKQGFDTVFAGSAHTTPTDTEGSKGEFELTAKAVEFVERTRRRPFFLYLAHNAPHIPFSAREGGCGPARGFFQPHLRRSHRITRRQRGPADGEARRRRHRRADDLRFHQRQRRTACARGGRARRPPPTPRSARARAFSTKAGCASRSSSAGPGLLTPGSGNDTPVLLTDLMPTLIEAAGLDASKAVGPLDGLSLLPLFRNGAMSQRRLFWHFPHYTNQGGRPGGAVRDGRWKLISHYEDGTRQLYDLEADPAETTDVSAAQPAVADDLSAALVNWRTRIGAQECTPNPAFDPEAHARLYTKVDVSALPPQAKATAIADALRDWRDGHE